MQEQKHTNHSKKAVRRRRRSRLSITFWMLLLSALVFAAGYTIGRLNNGAETAGRGENAESAAVNSCTIRYEADGELVETESVTVGGTVQGIGYPTIGEQTVIAWLDANGREVEVAGLRAYTDMTFTASMTPSMKRQAGYFPCAEGIFRPESPLTRLEAAETLYWLMEQPPEAGAKLSDVPEEDERAKAASAMVNAGYMTASHGEFDPDSGFTETEFLRLLEQFFRPEAAEAAVGHIRGLGSEGVSRAEAALVLNELLGLETDTEGAFFPDVEEGYWAYDALLTAGERSRRQWESGFVNIDGFLYCVQEDGYFCKNGYIGSLYFDSNGRYTSGDTVLDEHVAAAIRENTSEDMDRMEMLHSMYLYVRDGFTYLRRNFYETGDMGWALQEARTMYTTGMGNCYNYAAAFWAAARGLGYDAMAVSGQIGSDHSKHGWVEIPMEDGKRYVFDVEIEMAYRRDKKGDINMFGMEHISAKYSWLYNEYDAANRAAPRDRDGAFVLR